MVQPRHPWRRASLRIFLIKAILNGPWKKYLRETWHLLLMQVGCGIINRMNEYLTNFCYLPAGADSVSKRNKNNMNNVINCILRACHPCKRYSWRWHYIHKSRRKLRQKLTLWWALIVSQILRIVLLCRISILSSKNRCVGI